MDERAINLHLSGYHLGSIKMLFYLTGSSTQEHDAYKQDTVKCKLILSFVTLYQQYHLFKCSTLNYRRSNILSVSENFQQYKGAIVYVILFFWKSNSIKRKLML